MTDEVPAVRVTLLKGKKWPLDAAGRELDIGDFIVFVRFGMGASGGLPMFGHVTKITSAGKIWAKNIRLWNHEANPDRILRYRHSHPALEDKEVKDPNGTIILGKAIESAFTIAKLADGFVGKPEEVAE